ncbi:hypothetical protein TNCV_390881 [Trichonephila clavipes]|nr:hypothetical protein TNCV_390881 [Trichonephila clavipes]
MESGSSLDKQNWLVQQATSRVFQSQHSRFKMASQQEQARVVVRLIESKSATHAQCEWGINILEFGSEKKLPDDGWKEEVQYRGHSDI